MRKPGLLLFCVTLSVFLAGSISLHAATIYSNYSTGNDSTGDGSSGNPYKTFHQAYTASSDGDTIHLSGTFNWANADETGDSSSSGYTLGKSLTIEGDSATSTIIQAAATAGSAGRRVFTINSGIGTTIRNLMIRYGSGSSGAGIYISSYATTTLANLDINNNRTSTSGYGGGVYIATADVTISGSSFYNNAGGFNGGGIYQSATGRTTDITNSTFYANYNQWTSNAIEGGAIYISTGTTTLTNTTVVRNGMNLEGTARLSTYCGGVDIKSDANAKLFIKNSIVAENFATYSGKNIYRGSSGTVTNSGYNIIGNSSGFTATTGDWIDSSDTGTFTLNTVGTTGTLGLATGAAQNDSNVGTPTYYLNSTSVAVNNADGAIHGLISVPATDQRGGVRSGATDIGAFEVNATGLSVVQPTTQATSVTFSNVEYNSMTVTWTNGNGSRRTVFMKAANSGTATPVDGTNYSASSVFGSGDQIGVSGWYAIYDGNATSTTSSVNITGLTRGTDYIFQVFEYNGVSAGAADYFTDSASGNPATQASHTPVTIYTDYTSGNDSTGDGSSGTPYKTFYKAYTTAKNLDTIYLSGTFNWANADETGDSSSSGYTIGKELTLIGVSATSTIIQAASTAGSAGRRVFTISSGASTTMQNLMIRYGSGSDGAGIYAGATTTLTNVDINNNKTSTSGNGGGIYAAAPVYLTDSSVYENGGGLYGAGLYVNTSGKDVILTNSTFLYNYNQWTSNAINGGAFYVNAGNVTVTNCTLVKNGMNSANTSRIMTYGGGFNVANSSSAKVYLKNSIVAQNSATYGPNIYKSSSGVITNAGYNIVGNSTNFTATTGDWTDSADSGTFTLNTVGTTGTLNLAGTLATNDSTTGLPTIAIGLGSVAINNADGSAHNGVTIPTLDGRGASRAGAADIGAFEYNGGGLSVSAPTVQSSAIASSSIEHNSFALAWTNGDGSKRVAFMKAANSGTASPVNGTAYAASAVFGAGDQIGTSGWYAVYNDTATTTANVTITGLTRSTDYIIQVFEYNGLGESDAVYFTDAASGNPAVVTTHTPTTIYADYTNGDDSTGDGSSGSPYKTFHKAYTATKNKDTISLAGTFTWTNADETGDNSSGYTIGRELTIAGVSATSTIIQAAATAETASAGVFTIGTGASTTFKNLTMRYGTADYGSGIYVASNATTTLTGVDVSYNVTSATTGYGGGVYTLSEMNIENSSIHDNGGGVHGGGLYINAPNKNVNITNTTIYYNYGTWCCNALEGGGFLLKQGTTTLTNSTIVFNGQKSDGTGRKVYTGGGIEVANDALARLYIKNSIVAQNILDPDSSSGPNIYKYSSGTVTNNGYNIVGKSTGFTATTGDWVDATDSGTFTLNTVGTTGTLNLADAPGQNSSAIGTPTWAVTTGSIVVDGGSAVANNGVDIPATDQRGGGRDGGVDIGAYEFGAAGLADLTVPSVTLVLPGSASATSSVMTLTATASDNTGVASVLFYIDNTLIGSEDTSSPYAVTFDTTATTSGSHTAFAVARDTSDNYATSSSVSFTVDNAVPSVSLTSPTASATVGGTIYLTASASDDASVAGVKFYVDNTLIGSEDVAAPYSVAWNTTSTTTGSHSSFAVARDGLSNHATSSTVSFSVDNRTPEFVPVATTPVNAGATISWTSTVKASSKLAFGLTTQYASSTSELNTDTKVTSHEISLTGLPDCSFYHYATVGQNEAAEAATSTDSTFATGGCTGNATISTSTIKAITVASGGEVIHDYVKLVVPTSFTATTSSVSFQSNKLSGTEFFTVAGAPSGKSAIGSNVYNLKAFVDSTTTLSTFDEPLSVTFNYVAADVSGYEETSLKIYRYDSDWTELSSCSVDTVADTVTCSTTHFSDFAIFGDPATVTASQTTTVVSGNGPIVGANIVLPNTPKPRPQTIYPDGRVVYHDEQPMPALPTPSNIPLTQEEELAVSQNELTGPAAPKAYIPGQIFTKALSFGDTNAEVLALQKFLNTHGFKLADKGPGAPGAETDYFGYRTLAAVRALQDAHAKEILAPLGLKKSTGVFGRSTRGWVNSR